MANKQQFNSSLLFASNNQTRNNSPAPSKHGSFLINRLIPGRNGADSNVHLLQQMDDHSDGVNCLALSEDYSLLVSGGEDCLLRLWSTFSNPCECIGALQGHTDYITCCTVYRYLIISGSADCTLKVWRIQDSVCLITLVGHEAFVNRCATFGPILLSASFDNTVRVWTLSDQLTIVGSDQQQQNSDNLVSRIPLNTSFGQCLHVLRGHSKSVTQAMIITNDDGEQWLEQGIIQDLDLIITTSTDGTTQIYRLSTGELRHVLEGHDGPINCLAIDCKEPRFVYTAGADSIIKNWDIITGEFIKDLKGHQSSVLCLLSHNRILYSGSVDRTVRAWAMEFGQCTRVYYQNTAPVSCLQYFKGILYTGCNDYCARLYDSNSAVLKQTFSGHSRSISALQVVPGKLFTSSFDGRIMVWDCKDLQNSVEANAAAADIFKPSVNSSNHHEQITEMAESKLMNGNGKLIGKKPKRQRLMNRMNTISSLNSVISEQQFALQLSNQLNRLYERAQCEHQAALDECHRQRQIMQSSDGCVAFVSCYCCWPWFVRHTCLHNLLKTSPTPNTTAGTSLPNHSQHVRHRQTTSSPTPSSTTTTLSTFGRMLNHNQITSKNNDNNVGHHQHNQHDHDQEESNQLDSLNVRCAIEALEPYLRTFGT